MNWLIPKYYKNNEYRCIKCKNCGTEIIFNNDLVKINLDHSIHRCEGNVNQRSYY